MWYRLAIEFTVILHFLFILWVIFGALIAWKHPVLRWVHWISLAYGLLIEVFNWYCPLTLLEYELRRLAGLRVYEGSFIGRYLRELIYIDVPQHTLIAAALAVVLLNSTFYVWLARRQARE